MVQDITVNEMLKLREQGSLLTIDVRSPSEFRDSTIPGSVNIPLFDDGERAEIGTLYKQVSPEAAKERGLEIVSSKLPDFIKAFQHIDSEDKVVFCWRGGMRSKTAATLLSLMDVKVHRLIGGVRAYRHWIVETLDSIQLSSRAVVLHGNTGMGKTKILRKLHSLGFPVLDLEAMAGHRGSVFGHIGLNARNQKMFDAHLVESLFALQQQPYFIMEAESRRIGKVVLPEFLIQAKKEGIPLLIELPLDLRIQQIIEDYEPAQYKESYLEAFRYIKKRIHTPIAAEIESHLQEERYEEAVHLLLTYYYDPLYQYTEQQYSTEAIKIKAKSVDEAVKLIMKQLPTN